MQLSTDDSSYPHVAEYRVTLSFTASGRRYQHTFLQLGRPKDNAAPARGVDISREFHASVNQWLTDQGAAQHLYLASTPDAQSVHGNERLGLLKAVQRPLWGEDPDFVSAEWHDDGLTSIRKEQLLADAEQLGLLRHLTAAERRRGREQALSGRKATFAELLESFPRVIFALDWESAKPPRPYADFTARLAAISRGAFRLTDVQDGFGEDFPSKALVPFSIRHRGRLYRTKLRVQSDWLDAGVADLINEAMRAPGSPGRFYECLDGEGFIFLTPAQHRHLRRTQPALFSTVDTTQIDKADLPF